jgi:hypothetical protein
VRIKFAKLARKHRIGRQRVHEVIASSLPSQLEVDGITKLHWVGRDSRGLELEIVAVIQNESLLVIYAMPYHYRKRS